MKRSIRSVLCFAIPAIMLPVCPVAAGPVDSKDNGVIFKLGAEFFFYPSKWSADLDIDKLTPVCREEEGLLAVSGKV